MKRKDRWRQTAARVIYRSYPDQDLLPIDPPQPGEPISEFAVRAQEAGDTLFLFLCREANEDIDAIEYVARLNRAIHDLVHVQRAFARRARSRATAPKRPLGSARSGAASPT